MSGICAACGKTGGPLKTCTACRSVRYCGVDCQLSHRPEHRKECKRIAQELKLTTLLRRMQVSEHFPPQIDMNDADSFKTPPKPDCAICMLPLPYGGPKESKYFDCCGKFVCTACAFESYRVDFYKIIGDLTSAIPKERCPFCRTELSFKDSDEVAQLACRLEKNDGHAAFNLAMYYHQGIKGMQQDDTKYFKFLHAAAELGSSSACYCLAWHYNPNVNDPHFNEQECGITPTEDKMMHYYKEAAKMGHVQARFDLGRLAFCSNDFTLAHRHWMLSVARGHDESLEWFEGEKIVGRISEEKFSEIEAAHKNGKEEMASKERDRALRADFDFARHCLLFNEEETEN